MDPSGGLDNVREREGRRRSEQRRVRETYKKKIMQNKILSPSPVVFYPFTPSIRLNLVFFYALSFELHKAVFSLGNLMEAE